MLVYSITLVCACVLVLMVYRYDMYNKEPWGILGVAVVLGMAAAFGIGFAEDAAIEAFRYKLTGMELETVGHFHWWSETVL